MNRSRYHGSETVGRAQAVAQDPILYGKYQLLDLLARGGMGEVFKARSHGVEGFEKILVIKRILPELSKSQRFVEMFIDEAKIAVTLTHANIVQVFDLGFVSNTYFIAMEYVPGYDLGAILNFCRKLGRSVPTELAVYIVSEAAKGLDYAHRRKDAEMRPLGIVHRDVSPENILLSYEGEVKLTDFGIARSRASVQRLHQLPPGKLSYLAPEQAREEDVTPHADLFALGVVLYELLTGAKPHDGKTPTAVFECAKRGEIPPLQSVRADLPDDLAQIVTRSLAFAARDRWSSAGELYEDLIEFLYASGRRVGAHDLARFIEEIAGQAVDRRVSRPPPELSEIEAIFSVNGTGPHPIGVTPLAIPTRQTSSLPAPPNPALPPRLEWREVSLLAVADMDPVPVYEMAARYGGTPLLASEACSRADPGASTAGPPIVVFGLGETDGHDAQAAARCGLRVLSADAESTARAVVHSGRLLVNSEGELREHPSREALRAEALRWLEAATTGRLSASVAASKLLRGRFELLPAQGDAPRTIERERRADEGLSKFVGRKEELRKVGECLALANQGSARVLGIRGDAGTGKSRILTETIRRLRHAGHDVGFYVATCSPRGRATPLSAIHDLVRAVLGIEDMESEPRVREKLERLKLLGLSPAQRNAIGRVLGLSVHDISSTTTTTLESALLRISYKLAQDRLTVFAWDGAEMMDSASRALLGRLIEHPPEARVVVLLTYRPSDVGPWSRSPAFSEVVITPLANDEVARLIRHRLLATDVPEEIVREIALKTGGNPLYVEELLNAMRDSGALEARGGVVTARKGPRGFALPRTLRGLVASRVGRLPPAHRVILQLAVTFGPRFVPELVARAAEQDEATVRAALGVLEERGIVRAVSASEYVFAHDLLREVLYDGIAVEERAALHAAVAAAIETLRPAEVDAVVERLALHHREAGHREEAIRYMIRAAERFEAEHSPEAAIGSYQHAIDLLVVGPPEDQASVLDLYIHLGDLAMRTRSAEQVADRMAQAIELAESLDRDDYVARFAMIRGRLLNKASRFQEGRMWLDRAATVARERGDRKLLRDVALAAAEAHSRNGEYSTVAEFASEALALARETEDHAAQVRSLLHLAPAHAAMGDASSALNALKDAASLMLTTPDLLLEVELYKVRSLVFHQIGDRAEMIDSARRALDLAKEYGFPYEQAVNAHNLGEFFLRIGEDKRAFSALRLSYEVASEHGFSRLMWLNVCLLGFLDAMRFDSEQGKLRMSQAIDYAAERGYTYDLMSGKHLLAVVEQKLGNVTAAKALLKQVAELAERHGHARIRETAKEGAKAVDAGQRIPVPP